MLSSNEELLAKYPPALAARVIRLREIYNYWLANPSMKDRQLRDYITSRYGISQSSAYSDISVVHELVPLISKKSREFHRARTNEMLLETYNMAKARKDTKVMADAAKAYGKANNLEREEEQQLPYDEIAIQPYVATTDVRVLGIKPIPDLYNHIAKVVKRLSADFPDIMDVDFEEADLEEDRIFPEKAPDLTPAIDDSGQPEC